MTVGGAVYVMGFGRLKTVNGVLVTEILYCKGHMI